MSNPQRYIERSRVAHESLLPPVEALGTAQMSAWLTEMQSFSRIICNTWPPHMELAAQNEALAHARKEGWI